jgi:hypothetical protein
MTLRLSIGPLTNLLSSCLKHSRLGLSSTGKCCQRQRCLISKSSGGLCMRIGRASVAALLGAVAFLPPIVSTQVVAQNAWAVSVRMEAIDAVPTGSGHADSGLLTRRVCITGLRARGNPLDPRACPIAEVQ